jgi:Tfp pilus assembly protein PilF
MIQTSLEVPATPDQNFAWLWRAARLEHFRAMQTLEAGDARAAKTHFQAGVEQARRAELLAGDRVEAVFWRATCELEAARQEGTLSVARILGSAQKRLERACAIEEAFHHGGPLRVLGRLIQLKPLILGGNLDRALTFYDRALQVAPNNSTTLLYRADALLRDRQPGQARETLQRVLQVPSEGWIWECERDQKIARQWLVSRFD